MGSIVVEGYFPSHSLIAVSLGDEEAPFVVAEVPPSTPRGRDGQPRSSQGQARAPRVTLHLSVQVVTIASSDQLTSGSVCRRIAESNLSHAE